MKTIEDKLIGAQIVSVDEESIKIKKDGKIHKLKVYGDSGDCCGFYDFYINLVYEENSDRNPIITSVEESSYDDGMHSQTSVITFYGEHKELATIEGTAGSGSGYSYGAFVSITCETLDIDEGLVFW